MESIQYAEMEQIKTQVQRAWLTPTIEQSELEERTQIGPNGGLDDLLAAS